MEGVVQIIEIWQLVWEVYSLGSADNSRGFMVLLAYHNHKQGMFSPILPHVPAWIPAVPRESDSKTVAAATATSKWY